MVVGVGAAVKGVCNVKIASSVRGLNFMIKLIMITKLRSRLKLVSLEIWYIYHVS